MSHGEYRLPGEAYESINNLHPDETGRYGAFDKFKILADVAPWSDEYRFWRDYVTEYVTDEEMRKQAAQIKRQVAKRKQKYEFTEYRFKDADLEKMEVTVDRFLDDYTFLTEELGNQPVRMAGVSVRPSAPGVLAQYFQPGEKVTIGVEEDPMKRVEDDTYGTMKAVVFDGLKSINHEIIQKGQMKEAENDFSSTGVWARFTPTEIWKGANWESVAHHDSALNTKFLQVRTALEEYERDQIYGKDWATWENFGITDYLKPAIDEARGEQGFSGAMWAGASGFLTGGVIGRVIGGAGSQTKWGAAIGTVVGLGANAIGQAESAITGERWIPERRETEHEINEYFDILKYMKNMGLYNRAREELLHQGYDIDRLMSDLDERTERNKQKRRELEARRKELYIEQPEGWEDERKKVNAQLNAISNDWDTLQLPPEVVQALQYKEEAEQTLYAVDPLGDRMNVMFSMPYKDKWFFNEFSKASREEQEKILELVPENQRRIYKAIWGYGVDPQKPLEHYAEKYHIPDASWAGWRPEYSLEDIKVKVVQEEGLDLSDFNYWSDDVEASQYTPSINPENQYENRGSSFKGYQDMESRIRSIMQGQGIRDVQVTVRPSNTSSTQVHMQYEKDRSREVEDHLRYNMQEYV